MSVGISNLYVKKMTYKLGTYFHMDLAEGFSLESN